MLKKLVIIISVVLFSSNLLCKNLYFAGLAFVGNKDQNFRYPVAYNLFKQDKTLLSKTLRSTLNNFYREDINITFSEGNISSGNAIAFGFGLMDEKVERIISKFGVTSHYEIYGQVLIFDFIENKLIANYPVLSRLTNLTEKMPTKEFDFEQFKNMYLDLKAKESVFMLWLKAFKKTKVNEVLNSATIGVGNIIFSDEVRNSLPQKLKKNSVFKSRVAQKLEYNIAYIHNIPLVPYTLGEALGGKGSSGLITRFHDSVNKELVLPEKDFLIDLKVKGFRYKKNQSDYQIQHLWAAYIEFNLLADYGEDNLENLVNQKFRLFQESIFAKSANTKILDHWIVNETVLANLIAKVVDGIKTKDKKKIKEITKTNFKEINEKFNTIQSIFKKCL